MNSLRNDNVHLVLFFTRGVSLEVWDDVGMFDREVALYHRLLERGIRISFVTYGSGNDLGFADRIPGIDILCNRWNLPARLYEKLIPYLHRNILSKADIFKTNQTDGADIALRAARKRKKPLIARSGYMLSYFLAQESGEDSPETRRGRAIEHEVFTAADRIVVTTPWMTEDIRERIPAAEDKTVVIPNYVLTDIFTPDETAKKEFDIIFTGRLNDQKNPFNLIEAANRMNVIILVIGSGELRHAIEERFGSMGNRLRMIDRVAHNDLPSYFNRSRLFVLPSFYEGHPKTLVEAMSCGMAVIGGNSPGIRDVISHGDNGWLCGTDTSDIENAVGHLLEHPDLCCKLGQRAREFAVERYSLDSIVDMECAVYASVLGSEPAERKGQ